MTIRISNSRIHGKGIFACRDFKKGEIVLKWDSYSREISKADTDKLSPQQKMMVFDGRLYSSALQFMNHSCSANVSSVEGYDTAVRDIEEGEEVTCNYTQESIPFISMSCNCGSTICKKILINKNFKQENGTN